MGRRIRLTYLPVIKSSDQNLEKHIADNHVKMKKDFHYIKIVREWTEGIKCGAIKYSETDCYPSNKVSF